MVDPQPEITPFSPASRASTAISLAYALQACSFLMIIQAQLLLTSDRGPLLHYLTLVCIALFVDVAVYALGGLRGQCLYVLEILGRVRLLLLALCWPWLMPWIAELTCRSGLVPLERGAFALANMNATASFTCGYFILREVAYFFRAEPPSALDPNIQPKFGDCLPSNALLGGQFRLNKAELEISGRAVFIPSRQRKGLFVPSGLAMITHIVAGISLAQEQSQGRVPWLLIGSLSALLCRYGGRGKPLRESAVSGSHDSLSGVSCWHLEGCRFLCQSGELMWLMSCVKQLQACEAQDGWIAECSIPASTK